MGVGKSSYVNSILSALHYRIVRQAYVRGSVDKSITTELKFRPLLEYIKLADIWGWNDNNYSVDMFEDILKGKIGNGTKESEALEYNSKVQKREKFNCVIFFVPVKSVDNDGYIKKLQKFQETAEAVGKFISHYIIEFIFTSFLGVRYIFVLSQVDKVNPQLREYPFLIEKDSKVKSLKQQLAVNLGVPENQILPGMAYAQEMEKVPEIDYINLKILQTAIHACEDFFEDLDY